MAQGNVLDLALAEYFVGLVKRKKPEFSTLFLNAGAHIQHHYMLSSLVLTNTAFRNPDWYVEPGADPLLEVYQQYDEILGRLILYLIRVILLLLGYLKSHMTNRFLLSP